jgi:hypothetical protein
MKRTLFLVIVLILASGLIKGQRSSFYVKAGITNCMTKTMQVNPPHSYSLEGFDPRKGGSFGGRYNYKVSRYFGIGGEFQYLLKGHISTSPSTTMTYSNHYLNLSPFIGVFPFANSSNKYVSCISPEISFDYNYSIGTNNKWELFNNAKFYPYELGYTMKLTYQPDKFGVQFFYFKSISPFYRTQWFTPSSYDYKYSFVTGISILYKIF